MVVSNIRREETLLEYASILLMVPVVISIP